MNIGEMFKSVLGNNSNQQAPINPATNPQGQLNPGAIPNNAASTTTPPGATSPTDATSQVQPAVSPLEEFKDIWQTPAQGDAATQEGLFGQIDPKKLMEAAGRVDFAKSLNPETLKKVAAGGDDAMQAFAESLNQVARQVYAQSAFATTKIVEQAVAKAEGRFADKVPSLVKKHQVSDNLRSENPVFNNPAVQPLVSAIESQLTVKYPNATAGELSDMAKKYLTTVFSEVQPKKEPVATDTKGRSDDWSRFFEQ